MECICNEEIEIKCIYCSKVFIEKICKCKCKKPPINLDINKRICNFCKIILFVR